MIDEADYLSDSSLELVRRIINDNAQTGVVLVGLSRLKYKLENLRNDHQQLTSRVGVLLEVKRLSKADAEAGRFTAGLGRLLCVRRKGRGHGLKGSILISIFDLT
jgi:DNA transposition AAA+ family ATPase